MGQEVVYCYKCQKRVTSADFSKGQAYQVENNFCCSSCAVGVLETLPPRAKEQLLAKMFKATQERQSPPAKSSGGPPSASSTARVPHARPVPVRGPAAAGPLILGIIVAAVLILLAVLFLSSGPTLTPAAATTRPPTPAATPNPGPSPEEKRRTEAAKEALRKARDFASASPKDLEGQLRQWRTALAEAERTGYEAEARRETEKADARNKEAVAQELADLERQARDLASKRTFKAALELVDRARPKRSAPEWTTRVDALRRELDEKALAGPPWRPIFDGRSNGFIVSAAGEAWVVDNGAVTRDTSKPDQAAQSREDYGDGEIRFRFTVEKVNGFFITVRQAAGGQCRVAFSKPQADALNAGPHELIFSCRGSAVSATLDGTSVPVAVDGTVPPRGRLHFNCSDGSFRILALEMRDLP